MPFLDANGLKYLANVINTKYAGKNKDGAVVSIGADYAEYGVWHDGNPENEDRRGYFVTIVNGTNHIQKANADSAIIGVITSTAGFIGNYAKGAEDDVTAGLVGIVGQIPVIDNGLCTVGERCMPTDDGTAAPSSNSCGYKVIERIDDTHVRIMVSPAIDMIQRIKTDMDLRYNLGLGTEIPADADLNDYKTPGVYYWRGIAYATIANHPTNEFNGFMVVHEFADGDVIQHVFASGSNVEWRRSFWGSHNEWLPWYCASGVDSIVAEDTNNVTNGTIHWIKYANGLGVFTYHATKNSSDTVFGNYVQFQEWIPFSVKDWLGGGGYAHADGAAGSTLCNVDIDTHGRLVAYVDPKNYTSGQTTVNLVFYVTWK